MRDGGLIYVVLLFACLLWGCILRVAVIGVGNKSRLVDLLLFGMGRENSWLPCLGSPVIGVDCDVAVFVPWAVDGRVATVMRGEEYCFCRAPPAARTIVIVPVGSLSISLVQCFFFSCAY